ncbi:uncharacterized protein LOC120359071 [Solenopsis invicta]|uniref:uncharacterized protein LOC120359071 n=1 Tax=Solenopsis invicta TaxID=13686 RepID=UPI00193DFF34|nr:uncharacterized protein LOC120359071 [Solenopsis invicta]
MGSPLSPVIADIVMQDLESKVLNNINVILPFYVRYVDDIALAAPTEANLIDVSDTIVERKKYLVFPYLKDVSEKISTSLNKDIIRLGFRCLNKLDKFIKAHKDKNIKTECNNVVYKLNCNDCNASYVGQTKRKLKTRIKEHVNNIKLETAKISVISEHRLQQNHSIDWKNVKILDFEPNYHKRLISEMIHINEQKNGLNQKTDTELLDDCYNTILNKLVDM